MAEYPVEFDREVTLKDGAQLRIRPILPDDETRLVTLYGRLSRQTAYQRFFTVMKRLPADWVHHFANVDYRRRMALVAEVDWDWRPELVGVARYDASEEEGDTAEVAIVIQDYWQGRGLGPIMLNEILRAGEAQGLRRFRAHVLADNRRMLAMLSRVTHIKERTTEGGETTLLVTARPAPPAGTSQGRFSIDTVRGSRRVA